MLYIIQNIITYITGLLSTNLDTGKRGAWINMPRKPQTLKSLSGIDIKYSWKKAEVANTMRVAVVLEFPAATRGLYKCLTHHLQEKGSPTENVHQYLPVNWEIPILPELCEIAGVPPVMVEVSVSKLQ